MIGCDGVRESGHKRNVMTFNKTGNRRTFRIEWKHREQDRCAQSRGVQMNDRSWIEMRPVSVPP